MPEVIALHAPILSGESGLTVKAYAVSDGVVVNALGDSLTESPAGSARFTFTLDESRAGLGQLRLDVSDVDGRVWHAWLDEGDSIATETDTRFLDGGLAELSAPPAATAGLRSILKYVGMWFRNKSTQSGTQRKLYADDGTTVVATEAVSDAGGTFTKGEAS